MQNARYCRSQPAAFTLMEVVLALALFTISAIALANALNQIGLTTLATSDSSRRLELVDSYLQEAAKSPKIEAGTSEIEVEGNLHVKIIIEAENLTNQAGEPLPDMYRIRVQALEGERIVEEGETLRYAPLYDAQ